MPGGPHVERISELLPEEHRGYAGLGPEERKQAAFFAVQDAVEQKVHADCRLRLIPRLDKDEGRKTQPGPFLPEWGFDSLLGAMWLQFLWLVTMNGTRYCTAPGCSNPTSAYDRPDRLPCSPSAQNAASAKGKASRLGDFGVDLLFLGAHLAQLSYKSFVVETWAAGPLLPNPGDPSCGLPCSRDPL